MNISLKVNILFFVLLLAFIVQIVNGSGDAKKSEELNKARENAAQKQWGAPKREKGPGMKNSMPEKGVGSSVHSFVGQEDQKQARFREKRYNSYNSGDTSQDGTNQSRHP